MRVQARQLSIIVAVALVVRFDTSALAAAKQDLVSCDVGSCEVAMALEDRCPCETTTSHARYVRCVAHAAKRLAGEGMIAHHCRRRLARFAANGVCGVPNTTICIVPTSTCADDGTCTNDPNAGCNFDADCGTQCEVTTPDACDAAGVATPQTGSCESAGCFSPSGAFLD